MEQEVWAEVESLTIKQKVQAAELSVKGEDLFEMPVDIWRCCTYLHVYFQSNLQPGY